MVAQTAEVIGASLVVIGSRAGGGLGGRLLGLLPEALVRAVRCPVLVVRGQSSDWPPRRIVIVDDGSGAGLTAAGEGATLARLLAVPAELVSVVPRGRAGLDPVREASFGTTRADARRRAARLEAESGAEVAAWVTIGELNEALLGLASDPRILFALGRQPHRHSLGRTVSALLHQAAGPLLIVPLEDS